MGKNRTFTWLVSQPMNRLAVLASLTLLLLGNTAASAKPILTPIARRVVKLTAAVSTKHPQVRTFHDPIYGYTLAYPTSWLPFIESDGSQITLYNPQTRTTINPIIETRAGSPTDLIEQALSVAGASRETVASHPAVISLSPYLSEPPEDDTVDLPADGGPQQVQLVTLPVANNAGTTNVYLFRLTQPTNLQGQITPAEADDLSTFAMILQSLTLPSSITAIRSQMGNCQRVCWADANWDYNAYDDTSTLYCANAAWYFAAYSSQAYCGDEAGNYVAAYNLSGVQVPVSQTGAWQPNFQCADFVARALTQDGLVPGLNNGGINGKTPASSSVGDYGSYQAANGNSYALWNVGVPGDPGLSNYLLDNKLASNTHQNFSQARPGDVVFFIDQNGTYYHTMLITSLGDGYLVLDGHNAAQYHVVLKVTDYPLDIYHLEK